MGISVGVVGLGIMDPRVAPLSITACFGNASQTVQEAPDFVGLILARTARLIGCGEQLK